MRRTLVGDAPWAFSPLDWNDQFLADVLESPAPGLVESLATKHLEMGDLVILAELRRLRANLDDRVVVISLWTLDAQLAAASH